jgi:hypothetical protein
VTVAMHANGHRTEEWRTLAWEGGDTWADLLCDWADLQANPKVEIEALCTAAQLGGREAATRIYVARIREARDARREGRMQRALDDTTDMTAKVFDRMADLDLARRLWDG